MLAEYKRNTNIGVGIGFVLQIIGRVLAYQGSAIGFPIAIAGFACFIWGCVNYTRGKGYSGWLGALGLLSIVGLIILVLLPDKHK